ncbi:MAG: LIC12162 family protein [Sedimenticola sp.]
MSNKSCLAVTRIKECWDADGSVVFLDAGVIDYNDKDCLDNVDYKVLESCRNDDQYYIEIHDFVNKRISRYRDELSVILNDFHGVGQDGRYWGILLDIWLLHFLTVIFDRTLNIKNAQSQAANIYVKHVKLERIFFQTSSDFIQQCQADVFNQYLYAEAADVLSVEVRDYGSPSHELNLPNDRAKCESLMVRLKKRILVSGKNAIGIILRAWIKLISPVLILDGYFSKKDAFAILLRSVGRVVIAPSAIVFNKQSSKKYNEEARLRLKVRVFDCYDELANRVLGKCFPASFFENYNRIIVGMSDFESVPVLGSAIGLASNDAYKILAGNLISKGGLLLGFQHGGGYGILKYRLLESCERQYVNKFYGWNEIGRKGRVLPTAYLRSLKSLACRRRKIPIIDFKDILFVSTNNGRYVFSQHPDNSGRFLTMLDCQFIFFEKLNEKTRDFFLLRPYPVDYGWHYKERWSDKFSNKIRFDSSKYCSESLVTCRVYVTDHISTTWLQALFMGVPVVLYFDCDRYGMSSEARKLFEKLRSVGVLYDTPESAAMFLNDAYVDVFTWWDSPKTQNVVREFKDRFFNASSDFCSAWTDEMLYWTGQKH